MSAAVPDYTAGAREVHKDGARFWRVTVSDEYGAEYVRDYAADAWTDEDATDDLVQLVTGEWR